VKDGIYDFTKPAKQIIKDAEYLKNIIDNKSKNSKKLNNQLFPHSKKREYHNLSSKRLFSTTPEMEISDQFSFYLNIIKNILNNEQITIIKQQYEIENSWITIVKKMHDDPNFLESKYSYGLKEKIHRSEITLNTMEKKGVLKRRFPNIYKSLNKIEILMITFAIALSGIHREMGYTTISGSIGKKILHFIYLNDNVENIKVFGNKESILIKDKYSYLEFINILDYDNVKILKLGTFFLDILSNFPNDIFEKEFDQVEGILKNEPTRLIINPVHFDSIKTNLIVDPASLPMICKPNK
jgi:hypothetical protein